MKAGAGEERRCPRCIAKAVGRFATTLALAIEDGEDCAAGFFSHMWRQGHCVLGAPPLRDEPCAWGGEMARCGQNFVVDFLRTLRCRRRLEVAWPVSDDGVAWQPPGSAVDPQEALLRDWAASALNSAISGLNDRQQELLKRFYWRRESCAGIAAAFETTEHAVQQELFRARSQLRRILERRGADPKELLSALAPHPTFSYSRKTVPSRVA